jgi:HK97 family phage prohead protease
MLEKSAGIILELKELDSAKGTGVIRHSVYNSIDLANDISTKGMFNKSWQETKAAGVKLLFNHITGEKIGTVTDVYEDETGAYTAFKFGTWTKAMDVKSMAEEGVLEGASFGYQTIKKEFSELKSRRVRKLLEVKHIETSLLTVAPCHPEAGLVTLNKAFEQLDIKMLADNEQEVLKGILTNDMANIESLITLAKTLDTNSDLYGYIMYLISRRADFAGSIMDQLRWNAQQMASMKSYVDKMDNYLSKSKASDETIQLLLAQTNEYKNIISAYDTAITQVATEPVASDDEVKAMLLRMQIALTI